MPGPWRKIDCGHYSRQRPDGGYLRVWSKSFGQCLKVWAYSVVDKAGRVEEHGTIHTMKAARAAAERTAGLAE